MASAALMCAASLSGSTLQHARQADESLDLLHSVGVRQDSHQVDSNESPVPEGSRRFSRRHDGQDEARWYRSGYQPPSTPELATVQGSVVRRSFLLASQERRRRVSNSGAVTHARPGELREIRVR